MCASAHEESTWGPLECMDGLVRRPHRAGSLCARIFFAWPLTAAQVGASSSLAAASMMSAPAPKRGFEQTFYDDVANMVMDYAADSGATWEGSQHCVGPHGGWAPFFRLVDAMEAALVEQCANKAEEEMLHSACTAYWQREADPCLQKQVHSLCVFAQARALTRVTAGQNGAVPFSERDWQVRGTHV